MKHLHFVGTTLSEKAKKNVNIDRDKADAFGRSAFNRYYYAAYLEVRDLLLKFEPNWKIKHADAPKYLKTNLKDIFMKKIIKYQKNDLITVGQGSKIKSDIIDAGTKIAQVLEDGYKVRTISDYFPLEAVTFENNTFSLDSHSESEAQKWLAAVQRNKARILRCGKELNLV